MCVYALFFGDKLLLLFYFFLYYLWNTEILWSGNRDSSQLETNPLDVKKNTPSSKSFHLLWKTLPCLLGTRLIMLLFSSLILKNHIWLAILQLGMFIEKCNAYRLTCFFCQKLCVAHPGPDWGPGILLLSSKHAFKRSLPQSPCDEWMSQTGLEEGDAAHFPKRLLLLTSLPYN